MCRYLGALAVVLLLTAPAPAHAWGYDVHRFIMDRAIALLPSEIRPLFETNRATVVERSIDPDTWRVAGFEEEDPNHFLNIDVRDYGTYPFLALPRDYGAAVEKFGVGRVRANGTLPWRIEEFHGNVRRAFERFNTSATGRFDILLMSAALGHYISDATQPFHTVSNFDGQLTRQNGIHSRFETQLFARYRSRVNVDAAVHSAGAGAARFRVRHDSREFAALGSDPESRRRRHRYPRVVRRCLLRGVLSKRRPRARAPRRRRGRRGGRDDHRRLGGRRQAGGQTDHCRNCNALARACAAWTRREKECSGR